MKPEFAKPRTEKKYLTPPNNSHFNISYIMRGVYQVTVKDLTVPLGDPSVSVTISHCDGNEDMHNQLDT